jgi:hypothetical protein
VMQVEYIQLGKARACSGLRTVGVA